MARLTPVIIFVRHFERCLTFYQKVFRLRVLRIYKEKLHPPWAELQLGDIRFCLHGAYRGPRYRQGRPVAMHFEVQDIQRTVGKIKRFGGRVKHGPKRFDFRPAELQIAYQATFADPDGNEFEVLQVLEEFEE